MARAFFVEIWVGDGPLGRSAFLPAVTPLYFLIIATGHTTILRLSLQWQFSPGYAPYFQYFVFFAKFLSHILCFDEFRKKFVVLWLCQVSQLYHRYCGIVRIPKGALPQ